jgi:formiminoglutamate deiminase
MYALVGELDEERFEALARRAFEEMLDAGITCVGEFHYLHHGPGAGQEGRLDEALLAAASQAGIRLVLLFAYYRTGGIAQPLQARQARFAVRDRQEYWERFDHLHAQLDRPTQSIAAAAHSIRAVPIDDWVELEGECRRRGVPLHAHVEEQRAEITACLQAHGRTPLALLCERLELGARFTAVHLTHSAQPELERFLSTGANACLCPLTEADLGDGVARAPYMLRHAGQVCLGTDSNARISMLEELRWLEYAQRLAREERGSCADAEGQVARPLLRAATLGGARSLGLDAGAIAPGALADLVAIDLASPALVGWSDDSLPEALVFGAGDGLVREVCVGGRWVRPRQRPAGAR